MRVGRALTLSVLTASAIAVAVAAGVSTAARSKAAVACTGSVGVMGGFPGARAAICTMKQTEWPRLLTHLQKAKTVQKYFFKQIRMLVRATR